MKQDPESTKSKIADIIICLILENVYLLFSYSCFLTMSVVPSLSVLSKGSFFVYAGILNHNISIIAHCAVQCHSKNLITLK